MQEETIRPSPFASDRERVYLALEVSDEGVTLTPLGAFVAPYSLAGDVDALAERDVIARGLHAPGSRPRGSFLVIRAAREVDARVYELCQRAEESFPLRFVP